MIIGYARVSSLDQNLDRQIEALNKEGCEKIYTEKITGANTNRPQLQLMLDELKEGDTIIIKDLTRFSRSTRDLFDLLDLIKEKKCFLRSVSDVWLNTSIDNPFNDLLFHIMSALGEYERKMIKQRQKEGIALAKQKGQYQGRPIKYTENNPRFAHALELYEAGGHTIAEICKICSVSESTFYRYKRKIKSV